MHLVHLLLLLPVALVTSTDEDYLMNIVTEGDYMTTEDTPTPGPEMDSVYKPGNPGAVWSPQEVETTRKRILMMIYPDWGVKYDMGIASTRGGRNDDKGLGQTTENTLMRLVFHDCIPYADGSGGCDGCLNWHGMDHETPNPNDKDHMYRFDPVNATDNKGLDGVAEKLELIYTTLDWPFKFVSLDVSLRQSGKSRADLWQFAGLVALEQALERANRACDLDKWGRQQVTLLEGREACEIKLTKPLKMKTGRSDCVSDDPEGRGYVTSKPENQPLVMGDGNHVVDYGRNFMGVDAEHWTALQAIHGAVHAARIGLKYTWFGPGYISNMYFKMIANKKIYQMVRKGGDLSFYSGDQCPPTMESTVGNPEGEPVAMTGWRASCMYLWNTTEGGPCVLRPIGPTMWDAPNPRNIGDTSCVVGVDDIGECIMAKTKTRQMKRICGKAKCDENRIVSGMKKAGVGAVVKGAWYKGAPDQKERHNGWNNQFAFPYELGLFWKLTTGGVGQRAIGCTGLDEPFGEINTEHETPNWPYRNNNSPIFNSPAMQCELNDYAPEGRTMADIVDTFATDNEVFAEKFLTGWQMMTSNGYSAGDLVDGPENGWVGHYSLSQQGVNITPDFETFIANNKPVTFTDPTVDPWICGHRGHATTTCGTRFKAYYEAAKVNPNC